MNNNGERVLDISWGTIVKLAVAGFLVYVVFLIRDILVWVLFGIILSVLFDPLIDFLQKRRIPRLVSTIGVYLIIFGVLTFLVYATIPLFVGELNRFSQSFPSYFQELISPPLRGLGVAAFANAQSFLDAIGKGLEKTASNAMNVLFTIFGSIFATIFVLSVGIFLSIENKPIERTIHILFPRKYEELALDLWSRSQRKVSRWFFSRIISSLFVMVATYIALLLFDVRYPVSLSILAGVFNFVPVVGPLISGFLIALMVVLDSFLQAIFVVLAFILIQQIEENAIMPLLSRKLIGLPPALVIISLAIGARFWGIMGAVLAIPLAGILFEFLRDFFKKHKEESDYSKTYEQDPFAKP